MGVERLFKSFLARNGRVNAQAFDFCGLVALSYFENSGHAAALGRGLSVRMQNHKIFFFVNH
jgi:hypothetical protein